MYYIYSISTAAIAAFLFSTSFAFGQEIDFTSTDTFRASIVEMTEGRTDEEKEAFGMAVLRVLMSRHPETKDLEGFAALATMGELGESFFSTGGAAFDGITTDVIDAEITAIAPEGTATLEEDTATREAVLACINEKVVLGNPRFDNEGDGSWYTVDVTNNLTWPIRAYMFNYTIYGDGRSVPVKEDRGGGEVSGGIEPGETKTIRSWAGADIRPYTTTSIELTIRNLFDVENRSILPDGPSFAGFPDEDSPLGCE